MLMKVWRGFFLTRLEDIFYGKAPNFTFFLGATEQKNGENQSKRNSRNKQTKRKSKREFDRDEIEFEKRGTKELLGEVEVSSDEDDEGEGDNDRQQQSRMSSASHSSPLDVSYEVLVAANKFLLVVLIIIKIELFICLH